MNRREFHFRPKSHTLGVATTVAFPRKLKICTSTGKHWNLRFAQIEIVTPLPKSKSKIRNEIVLHKMEKNEKNEKN